MRAAPAETSNLAGMDAMNAEALNEGGGAGMVAAPAAAPNPGQGGAGMIAAPAVALNPGGGGARVLAAPAARAAPPNPGGGGAGMVAAPAVAPNPGGAVMPHAPARRPAQRLNIDEGLEGPALRKSEAGPFFKFFK